MSEELDEARATIERVRALVAPWVTIQDVQETHSEGCHAWHPDCLVSAIRAALRVTRIPEPGLWGVVEASYCGMCRRHWVREERHWFSAIGQAAVDWDELTDPVLVRDGI